MNVPLLVCVLVLGGILFIMDVMFARRLYKMPLSEFVVIWGGLYAKPQIYIWCTSGLVSSIGGILTFYLDVAFTDNNNVLPLFVFAAVNISYIRYIYVVEDKNKYGVLLCLRANVVLYIILFIHTIVTFPINTTLVSDISIVYITHFCNAVTIFHVVVMDWIIWWNGWEKQV